jgi:hypothetical protein
MHPLFYPVYVLDRRIQEGTSPPKWTKRTTQKIYVGHLHHYSKSVPMVWDPKTKLVSPQFYVMFDDNFDTVKAPDPIRTSNKGTPWIVYLKQIDIHMMIHLAMNTHTCSLTGEKTYTHTI